MLNSKYTNLYKKLQERILKLKEKLNLIQSIQVSGKPASLEQQEKLAGSVNDALSTEEIALILEYKSQKKSEKNIEYQPFILQDYGDLLNFKSFLASAYSDHNFHFDIVSKPGGDHCSAFQLHKDEHGLYLFGLDAASMPSRYSDFTEALLNAKMEHCFQRKIQHDEFNCSIFAIQDLNSMHILQPEELSAQFSDGVNALSPRFFRNTQNLKDLEDFQKANATKVLFINKRKNKTLVEYLQMYQISIEVTKSDGSGSTKQQNRAIDFKAYKYLLAAQKILEDAYQKGGDELIDDILRKRIGLDRFSFVHDGLSDNQKRQVKDIYNNYLIDLVINHQIDPDRLSLKLFHTSSAFSREAYEYILKRLSIDSSNEGKEQLYKELKPGSLNIYRSQAIELGLPPENVKKADCFNNEGCANQAVLAIKKDPQIFYTIKDLKYAEQIQAFIDFDIRDIDNIKLLLGSDYRLMAFKLLKHSFESGGKDLAEQTFNQLCKTTLQDLKIRYRNTFLSQREDSLENQVAPAISFQ